MVVIFFGWTIDLDYLTFVGGESTNGDVEVGIFAYSNIC